MDTCHVVHGAGNIFWKLPCTLVLDELIWHFYWIYVVMSALAASKKSDENLSLSRISFHAKAYDVTSDVKLKEQSTSYN